MEDAYLQDDVDNADDGEDYGGAPAPAMVAEFVLQPSARKGRKGTKGKKVGKRGGTKELRSDLFDAEPSGKGRTSVMSAAETDDAMRLMAISASLEDVAASAPPKAVEIPGTPLGAEGAAVATPVAASPMARLSGHSAVRTAAALERARQHRRGRVRLHQG